MELILRVCPSVINVDSDDLKLLARRPRTLPRPAASIDLVIATRVSTVADGTAVGALVPAAAEEYGEPPLRFRGRALKADPAR